MAALPAGCRGEHALALSAPGEALVSIGPGTLKLSWTVLPPCRMALIQLPRMNILYRFDGVDPEALHAFMRCFDRCTHRGGG